MKYLLNFKWEKYIECNPDLKKNWSGPIRARVHYVFWGVREQRRVFNIRYRTFIKEKPIFKIPPEKIIVKPRVLNKDNFEFVDYRYYLPVTNIYKLKNIIITNDLILNSNREFLSQFSWYGLEFEKYDRFYSSNFKKPEKLSGTSLYLGSTWGWYNIAHNVLDGLSRMACYDEMGINFSTIDHFLVNTSCSEVDMFLKMMGIPKNKVKNIHGNSYLCEEIIISEMPGCKRQYKKILKKYFRKILNIQNVLQNQKILLMNRKNGRIVLNDFELCKIAERNNLKIFKEHPSFSDFSAASVVISPHSSTLYKLMFCKDKTKVIEFISDAHQYSYYYEISRVFDLEYIGILCSAIKNNEKRMHWNILVDTELLDKTLNKIIK